MKVIKWYNKLAQTFSHTHFLPALERNVIRTHPSPKRCSRAQSQTLN